MILDIDHFKTINDRYGHQYGDKALKAIATTLQNSIRSEDFVARYGGEEFVLWLPDCGTEQVESTCKHIMHSIAALNITDTPITVSIGSCCVHFTEKYQNSIDALIDLLISKADKAMYTAKKNGRNRYEMSSIKFDSNNSSPDGIRNIVPKTCSEA